MTFLGPLFISIIVGFFFLCTVIAFAACAVGSDRELDELDYDDSHPDGFVRHYARVSTEVTK